ncbi:hypothetical protein K458DRAFT_441798 [Lentithecium fluviatile CBS 122367]|uniref:DUF7726 domain-containing protein n=1 Tax=Lentithecium fluviatile CBS 122367 TaxID=1168545 RepID=A0A6G1J7M7_9PLEO|nr:hypothetical protein K458DRAFT_441798 [Lentithecium fluviatile CBS 122367]
MTVCELQKAIDVSSAAYSRFMAQHVHNKGLGSTMRELRGMNTVKRAKTSATGAMGTGVVRVEEVVLEREMEDNVPTHCHDIRRKISAHLQKPGITAASFLRTIGAQYHLVPKGIRSKLLKDFRSKRGPSAGNISSVFYGVYVYFEKLQVKEAKPKIKKWEEVERIYSSRVAWTSRQCRIMCMLQR